MAGDDLPQQQANRSEPSLPENFAAAVAALKTGELVVFPTETFYGIGADPMLASALAAILRVKGRDPGKPIALIAADKPSAFAIAREIPAGARLLAEIFWPGPLTLILPARAGLHESLVGPSGGIGVRISPHPTAHALASAAGGLLTATSANLAAQPPAQTLAEARESLGARISVYLDGGALRGEAASTVVEFGEDNSFRIVRPGAIPQGALASALRRAG
jgi:L-threonylcarbamoyladenylate synthase